MKVSLVIFLALQVSIGGCVAKAPRSPVLNWSAPRLLVHVDHVDAARVRLFEGARLRWVARLRNNGNRLDDGRPVLWSAQGALVQTYLTFYPFTSWLDLEARKAAGQSAEASLGKAALDDYNTGDAALVPPHAFEIWAREPELDLKSADAAGLDISTARFALLEQRTFPPGKNGEELERLWSQLQSRVGAARATIQCTAYWSLFGNGNLILLWLSQSRGAPDTDSLLGNSIAELAPVQSQLLVERRLDLSNLPAR